MLRGRAVRSSVMLLSQYKEIEMYFVAPSSFQITKEIENILNNLKIIFHKTNNLESIISEIDCIYMTRLQDEYDQSGESSLIDYSLHFQSLFLSVIVIFYIL